MQGSDALLTPSPAQLLVCTKTHCLARLQPHILGDVASSASTTTAFRFRWSNTSWGKHPRSMGESGAEVWLGDKSVVLPFHQPFSLTASRQVNEASPANLLLPRSSRGSSSTAAKVNLAVT